MATFEKQFFSETANGEPIDVPATSSPGTHIHTATNGNNEYDEIWLFISNQSTENDATITIEFGTSDPIIKDTVPAGRSINVIPGIPLKNGSALKVYGTGSLTAFGYVNRRSP